MLKSFLELFSLTDEELADLWLKALDPQGLTIVPEPDLYEFIERLARGSLSEDPIEVSKNFAERILQIFDLEGCTLMTPDKATGGEVKAVDMQRVRKAFLEDQVLSIHMFNQLLKTDCMYAVKSANHELF